MCARTKFSTLEGRVKKSKEMWFWSEKDQKINVRRSFWMGSERAADDRLWERMRFSKRSCDRIVRKWNGGQNLLMQRRICSTTGFKDEWAAGTRSQQPHSIRLKNYLTVEREKRIFRRNGRIERRESELMTRICQTQTRSFIITRFND
jgi:hypothetical protein